jgi:hypothetical protein
MAQPGLWNYIKEAFKVPNNLILLSGGLLAGLVSFHPGVVWPVVAAIELLYLLSTANSSRFQAVVKARRRQRQQDDSAQAADRLIGSLNEARRRRFEAVRNRCLSLQHSIQRTGAGHQIGKLLENEQVQSVNQLLWVFLRTLAYEQALELFCRSMPKEELERTLSRAETALQSDKLSESMRTAYRDNVEVLKKRLENLQRAEQNLEAIEARLVRVENSIMLIQEQALTRQDPAFIEAEVNSATAGLTSVEQMLSSMDIPAVDTGSTGPTPELLSLGMSSEGSQSR